MRRYRVSTFTDSALSIVKEASRFTSLRNGHFNLRQKSSLQGRYVYGLSPNAVKEPRFACGRSGIT